MYIIYPFIAVLIWSINSIVTKMASEVISPTDIACYRWLVAFIVLTPFAIRSTIKQRKVIKKHFWQFFVLGCLGMFMFQSLAYYAAQTISASFLGVANGIIPILTLILSLFVLNVKPSLGLIIGGALSLIGLIWIVSGGQPSRLIENGIGLGEVLIFLASLAYALYGVLLKKWNIQVTQWASLYVQVFCGLLCLIPLFILSGPHSKLTSDSIMLVFFAAIPASIIAPITWMLGIKKLNANTCAILLNLAPVFTAIIAYYVLDEQLQLSFIIGGSLVVIGVFIAQFMKKKTV